MATIIRPAAQTTRPGPVARIGPGDDGRRMSLAEFEFAKTKAGYHYELGRGVVIVSDVPNPPHLLRYLILRDALIAYGLAHPELELFVVSGMDIKILIEALQSERHPDLAVYMTPPPREDSKVWSIWIPELVIEFVSSDSARRDYEEKPDENLAFGVREYWIIDPQKNHVMVLQRSRGRWKDLTIKPPAKYKPDLLPGFTLDVKKILEAGKARRKR